MATTHHEVMSVAEFEGRHKDPDAAFLGKPQVSPEEQLTDTNGIPLPLEATVTVEYIDGRPRGYCVTDEHSIGEKALVRHEGEYRTLKPHRPKLLFIDQKKPDNS